MVRAEGRSERRRSTFREYADNHTGGFDRTSVKLPEGVNVFNVKTAGRREIEIAGYIVGKGNPHADPGEIHPERTFYTHKNVGVNEDTYICPAKTSGKKCPICQYVAKLKADGADKKEYEAFYPKERQLWWVWDHSEPDKGWQLWDISYHLFGKQLVEEVKNSDEEEGLDFFYDLAEGMTLRLGFKEKTFNGKTFTEVSSIRFKPRDKPLPKGTTAKLACLDDLLIIHDYAKLKAIFLQEDGSDEVDSEEAEDRPNRRPAPADDDDDTPPPKAKRKPAPVDDDDDEPAPKAKKRPAPADDDDDEPAPAPKKKSPPKDDFDDDDDEPAPKKRKPAPVDDDDEPAPKKRKPAAKDEDDDDEAPPPKKRRPAPPDDDDDEEPAPRRKTKAPAADEDDDEPAPKRKPAKAADDDDDWDDFDEAPPKRKKA